LFKKTHMKHIFIFTCLMLICSASTFGQHTLEVTVAKIKDIKGTIRVAVYNNENDFLKNLLEGKIVKASAEEVTVVFTNLKPGHYALSVYHDVNENNKMDSNFIGIPTEPYGFSNNVMGTFGPPSFENAKVKVEADTKSVINLR
jgi:uncharacterized protein (DUF2141 family)